MHNDEALGVENCQSMAPYNFYTLANNPHRAGTKQHADFVEAFQAKRQQLETLTGQLTKAQREAIETSRWRKEDTAWHPEGWYCSADKRVRRVLADLGLIRDYCRMTNRLTPLGEDLRTFLSSLKD